MSSASRHPFLFLGSFLVHGRLIVSRLQNTLRLPVRMLCSGQTSNVLIRSLRPKADCLLVSAASPKVVSRPGTLARRFAFPPSDVSTLCLSLVVSLPYRVELSRARTASCRAPRARGLLLCRRVVRTPARSTSAWAHDESGAGSHLFHFSEYGVALENCRFRRLQRKYLP